MIDLQLYYWASQLVVINDWMCGGWSDPTYRRELLPLGLEGTLGMMYGAPVPPNTLEGTRAVVMAWRGALRRTGWERKLTAMTPLWVGTWLKQTAGLEGFGAWDKIGISLLGDIMGNDEIMAFSELREEFGLHHTQLYRYLQLRHALTQYKQSLVDLPDHNPLEAKLLNGAMGKGGISKLYKTLVINSPECFSALRSRWEEMSGELEEEEWREARMAPRELAISSRLRLIQFKYLYLIYRTPGFLNKIYPSGNVGCPRCLEPGAGFLHMT